MQGLCKGDCRAYGGACTANNQCCEGSCQGGVCVGPCKANGSACAANGDCCGGACTGGLCCKAEGGACAGDGECCAGMCFKGACSTTCSNSEPCEAWLFQQTSGVYDTTCGSERQQIDEVVACLCVQCGEPCGGASCTTALQEWKGYSDPAACKACLENTAVMACDAQLDACKN
jgi:hypothetical protein